MKRTGITSLVFTLSGVFLAECMLNLKTRMRTSSSPVHDPYDSSRAVDGRYGSNPLSNCFVSTNAKSTAWWRGDIGHISRIINIDIQFREGTGRQNGYFLYVSNTSSWTAGRLCYHDDDPDIIPDVIQNKTCELDGRYVIVVTHSDSNAYVEICEIDVYGCPSNFYGEKCEFPCHCQLGCNTTSGVCDTPDCQPGWKGRRCDTECGPHLFGANCSHVCHCRESGCNHITGLCDKPGCLPGYRGISCSQECSAGTFGADCSQLCHCKTSGCSHVTGICKTPGCSRGWHDSTCNEACGPETFGEDCKQTCHCQTPGCNPFIGTCYEPGCKQGWTGNSCDVNIANASACPSGKFGEDCAYVCHCKVQACDPVNGTCTSGGCKQGWSGEACDHEVNGTQPDKCDPGRFGQNCSLQCHCDVGYCDHVTGECVVPGCLPGWRGPACNQSCGQGTFGYNCNNTCHCLFPGCDPANGTCDRKDAICQDGWTGDSCDREFNGTLSDECDPGRFGQNCSLQCHCDVGYCDHVTGECVIPGCLLGWRGPACNQSCGQGRFGYNCNNTCHCLSPGCDPVNGTCDRKEVTCQDGWTGDSCDREVNGTLSDECDPGRFGQSCSLQCHCDVGYCDHVTGECVVPGCLLGWRGPACNQSCGQGTFGYNCNNTCHCLSPGCDPVNGTCDRKEAICLEGWTGDSCDRACPVGTFGARCSQTCYCRIPGCHHVTGICDKTAAGCLNGWIGYACNTNAAVDTTCTNTDDILTAIHESATVCPHTDDLGTAILLCVVVGTLLSLAGHVITVVWIFRCGIMAV
ncbi:multiple epidermal growth factor-like domains protein 6 isoform X2 [Pecten maximus]|uniref:multiple epidermal growth factor-like domains protein 6 isoform X2 n=1 Tax=Pecten maximus TaxID=6579 RepID=UPI001458237D|nr:multiple epidermal growth factor-like domains protein 6 isoform X2 [Pecten maximus]